MKKLKEAVVMAIMAVILVMVFMYAWIGAVLQESYKLDPLTEAEIMEVHNESN